MPLKVPGKIEGCRTSFEKYFQEEGELAKPREILQGKIKNDEAELAEIEELLAQHVRLLGPVKETYQLFRSYVDHLKQSMEEKLEQAEAAGDKDTFKKGTWYTERKDTLDDLADDANSMFTLNTELEYYVNDLESKVKRASKPKKKNEAADKQTGSSKKAAKQPQEPEEQEWSPEATVHQPKKAEAHHQPQYLLKGNPEPEEQERAAEGIVHQPKTAALVQTVAYQPQYPLSGTPQAQRAQTPVPEGQAGTETASGASSYFQNELRWRDEKLDRLKEKIEELKSEKTEYKQKCKAQKNLTAKAEDELQRLKDQNKRCDELNKDQQKLLEKMEANHQELLNTVRQGISNITIEVLRSSRH